MTASMRILVAGIGNIFWGDDAFGVEVAHRLARRDWPDGVRVVDFGIRGLDLAYALLDNYDAVIMIDATRQGGTPGSIYVIEPEVGPVDAHDSERVLVETHAMVPEKALRLAAAMGAQFEYVRLVGCEPEKIGSADNMIMGLSGSVQKAVDRAAPVVEQLVERLLNEEHNLVT